MMERGDADRIAGRIIDNRARARAELAVGPFVKLRRPDGHVVDLHWSHAWSYLINETPPWTFADKPSPAAAALIGQALRDWRDRVPREYLADEFSGRVAWAPEQEIAVIMGELAPATTDMTFPAASGRSGAAPALWTPSGRDPLTPAPPDVHGHRFVAFARDEAGVELWPAQAELAVAIVESTARVVTVRVGRRSGKSLLSCLIALWEAIVRAPDHLAAVRHGERPVVLVLGPSRESAGELLRTLRGLLEQPGLSSYLGGATEDRVTLSSGIDIQVLSTSSRSARGRAAPLVVADELAHFLDPEGRPSNAAARSMYDATYPSVAQFPRGRWLGLSTPMYPSGTFAELVEQAATDPATETHHLATWEVVPRAVIPESFYASAFGSDPESAKREWGGEFSSTSAAVLDEQAVRNAARSDAIDLPPVRGPQHWVSIDPAYAKRGDRFAAIVGHVARDGTLIVQLVRAWGGSRIRPLNHDKVMSEVAGIANAYGARVVTDQFAGAAVEADLRLRGVSVRVRPWTSDNKVLAAAQTRQRFWSGRISIPADRDLIAELTALEQVASPSGRTSIRGGTGSRDDLAMALLQLVAVIDDTERIANAPIEHSARSPWD